MASHESTLRRSYVDADEARMQRALQRLNGGVETAKKLGRAYSEINRSKIAAQQASDAEAGVVKLEPWQQDMLKRRQHSVPKHVSERAIPVPRVGVGRRDERPAPIAFVPHRRTGEELRAEHNGYERERAPRGAPSRSSDDKKDELAMRNQLSGKTADEVLREQAGPRRQRQAVGCGLSAPTEEEQMVDLRGEIADEIAERQDFLDQMTAAGRGNAYAPQLNAEIAERMADLRRLESLAGPS
jgi:hypothetical protein